MTTCIIPAAGRSSRFQELGKHYPKCVLPFQGKPIISHIIEKVTSTINPTRFVIVAMEQHVQDIENAVSGLPQSNIEVIRLDTEGMQGPGRSIWEGMLYVREQYGDENCFVHLSDMVVPAYGLNLFWNSIPNNWQPPHVYFTVRNPPDGDYRRWCVYDKESNALLDKPSADLSLRLKEREAWVLDGLYYFSREAVANVLDGFNPYIDNPAMDMQEVQISELIELGKNKTHVLTEYPILDFGTVQEYLTNKGSPRSRSFNTVVSKNKHEFVKSSTNAAKLASEACLYQNAPREVKSYFPNVIEYNGVQASLTMENIRSINLRDLYVYIDRSFDTWVKVFQEVKKFNTLASGQVPVPYAKNDDFWKFLYKKTLERTRDIRTTEVHNFLSEFQGVLSLLQERGPLDSFYHGDLHFANMFYCFTYGDLKLVDPRGEFVGNALYDIAKLMHSVYGRYDWIDGEFYRIEADGSVTIYDRGTDEVRRAFEFVYSEYLDNYGYELFMLTASLFLTMIPLHTHSQTNQQLYYNEFHRLWAIAQEYKQ